MTKLFLPHRDGKIGQSVREKDVIALLAWSNTAQAIRVVLSLRPASGGEPVPITIDLTVTSNRLTSAATVVVQQDGEIDGGAIFSVGPGSLTQRGMCYAQVAQLGGRGNIFMAGYVYSGHAPRFGEVEEPGPAGGHGTMTIQQLAQPAAGVDYADLAVPTGSIWKPRGLRGQLVTGAGVANREFSIGFVDATAVFGGNVASEIQTASLTVDYLAGLGLVSAGVSSSLAGGAIAVGIPDMLMSPSTINSGGTLTLRFKTFNLQAADQWSIGRMIFEEWVMPN